VRAPGYFGANARDAADELFAQFIAEVEPFR
jgi:hypothetical protein